MPRESSGAQDNDERKEKLQRHHQRLGFEVTKKVAEVYVVPSVVKERILPAQEVLNDLLANSPEQKIPASFYFWKMSRRGVCVEEADALLNDVFAMELYGRTSEGDIFRS